MECCNGKDRQILFLEQTEVLGSPQTIRLSLHLLVSNPTTFQRALGYLGTWPSAFPVQNREVTKAQGCCLPSWLHQAAAWDCRSRLSSAHCRKKCSFPKSAPFCSPSSGAPGQRELSAASLVRTVCAAACACEAGVADPAGVTCQSAWCLWLSRRPVPLTAWMGLRWEEMQE